MLFMYDIIYICQHGGIGRRTGLKIQRWQHRAGSTPAAGIIIKTRFVYRPQKVRPKNLTFWGRYSLKVSFCRLI